MPREYLIEQLPNAISASTLADLPQIQIISYDKNH